MPATSADQPETLGPIGLSLRAIRLTGHFLIFLFVFLTFPLHRAYIRPLAAWWDRRLLHILGFQLNLLGRPSTQTALTVSNHVSWLDIVLLGGLFRAAFVSKQEVRNWPVIGRFAELLGTVFLPRGQFKTGEASGRVQNTLGSGQPVVLFPSATTISELLPPRFHARMFAAAIEGNFPIQPVAIHYRPEGGQMDRHHPWATWTGDQSLAPHFLRLCRLRGIQVDVHIAEPIEPSGLDRRQLANLSHQAIAGALAGNDQAA